MLIRNATKCALLAVAGILVAAGTFIVFTVVASLARFGPGELSPRWAGVYVLAVSSLAVGAGLAVVWRPFVRLVRSSQCPKVPRTVARLLVAGYVFTAVFGVPACQTSANQWAVSEYKRLRAAGDRRVWDTHPYIATYLAVPVLPGVVLDYHEYQLSGLYGFGGFELWFWYGTGTVQLGQLPLWVS